MSLLLPNKAQHVSSARRRTAGLTLVELLIAATITTMLSVALSGLVLAVQAAWEHTRGTEDSAIQARVAFERIKYMVSHAGVYQVAGQPAALGIGVVEHSWFGVVMLPDILVVWSGGRQGGMAEQGVLQRLPAINELVIYSWDPGAPRHLVEITAPSNTNSIDFSSGNFASTILSLIESSNVEFTLISDRIRRSDLPGAGGLDEAGNIRFELVQTPSDDELAGVVPGSETWKALKWCQGIVSLNSGMRHAHLRMEIQIEPYETESSSVPATVAAIPFFGSASYRYVYQP